MYTSNQLQHGQDHHVVAANSYEENRDAVEELKAGNAVAFAQLIVPLTSRMDRAAQVITRNSSDAEDVRQSAILKAYLHRQQLRSVDKFTSWIMRITVNEALIRHRHERSHMFSSLDECAISDLPVDHEVPLSHVEREETRVSVRDALRSLNPDQREILMLHYWEEVPVERIAQRLRITRANVKTRLFRARQSLRGLLERPRLRNRHG